MENQHERALSLTRYNCFSNVHLQDSRLDQRLEQIVTSICKNPGGSFPEIFPTKAKLEGFYRFMNNEKVSASTLFNEACKATIQGLPSKKEVILAIHDTSAFDFTKSSSLTSLGRLTKGRTGFYGHFCIGVNLDREIHGPLGVKTWVRTGEPTKRKDKGKKYYVSKNGAGAPKEKDRWIELISEVQSSLAQEGALSVVHVADREADDYVFFAEMLKTGTRFVFRAKSDRNIMDQDAGRGKKLKLFNTLNDLNYKCMREIFLPHRKQTSRRPRDLLNHPSRSSRMAQLGVSAKEIEICRTLKAGKYSSTLKLNFVRVFEVDAPAGETPVEWILTTTEPIATEADLLNIVDIYRCRWTIEEFFKGLKTGCSFEKRGLESLDGLLRCLAIFVPLACKLYNLNYKTMNGVIKKLTPKLR